MPSNHRLTRSDKIKKYESVYNFCQKQINNQKRIPPKKNTRSKRNTNETETNSSKNKVNEIKKDISKKKLNIYQKFVQEESKKKKYHGMDAKERMTGIGKAWKKKNKKK